MSSYESLLREKSTVLLFRMASYLSTSASSFHSLDDMLKPFCLHFTKNQLVMFFNLSELHKAHVLHHWRLVGIPMITQQVNYANEGTLANCHLCNHPFWNLYEIKKTWAEEKALFAAATRKHQTKAARVIGGIRNAAAVTRLRDALLSSALYVCFACAAPVLGARYQCREAKEMVHIQTSNDAHATAVMSMELALPGIGRVETPESENMLEGSMSAVSSGPIESDST